MTIPTKIWRFPGIQLIFWNLIALEHRAVDLNLVLCKSDV